MQEGPDVAGTTPTPGLGSGSERCTNVHVHGPARDADSTLGPFLWFCFMSDMRAPLGSGGRKKQPWLPGLSSDATAARGPTSKRPYAPP